MRWRGPAWWKKCLSAPQRFLCDRRAVIAVEFALVAPIALMLLFGVDTLCDAMTTKRKLTITAHSIADLIARQASVNSDDLTNILNATAQIVAPYNLENTSVVVAELQTDGSGDTTVTWSQALNATALTAGAKFNLPSGLAIPDTYIIYAYATYNYAPILGGNLFGNMVFNSVFFENPRDTACVQYPPTNNPCPMP